VSLFRSYSDVLKRRFASDFNLVLPSSFMYLTRKIIQEDTYMPMTVSRRDELKNIEKVALYGVDGDSDAFPQTLLFSQLYPLCCSNIRAFVTEYYMFSDEFIYSQHDVDEILRRVCPPEMKGHFPLSLLTMGHSRWTNFSSPTSINLYPSVSTLKI
jgi:exocyst complex component 6